MCRLHTAGLEPATSFRIEIMSPVLSTTQPCMRKYCYRSGIRAIYRIIYNLKKYLYKQSKNLIIIEENYGSSKKANIEAALYS